MLNLCGATYESRPCPRHIKYSVQKRKRGIWIIGRMYSNKFDTPRQAAREKYYGNDRKPGTRILSIAVPRANRRLRTCNDRFRSKRELSIADVGRRHCYCLRSTVLVRLWEIRVYEGSIARPSYGLRCIRILRFGKDRSANGRPHKRSNV